MTSSKRRVSLGSVSHGTMRLEDLIPAFGDLLKDLDTVGKCGAILAEADGLEQQEDGDYVDSGDAAEVLSDLFDALNEFAPSYCYFGAHPGDGSDYGFWHSEDAITDAIHDGELATGTETPEWPHGKPFLHVSDHGNMTLYSAEGEELWAIV